MKPQRPRPSSQRPYRKSPPGFSPNSAQGGSKFKPGPRKFAPTGRPPHAAKPQAVKPQAVKPPTNVGSSGAGSPPAPNAQGANAAGSVRPAASDTVRPPTGSAARPPGGKPPLNAGARPAARPYAKRQFVPRPAGMQSKLAFVSRTPVAAPPQTPARTDWGNVAKWYDDLVGDEGSEYHREVIFPGLMRLLAVGQGDRVLDVACGQGVLCRQLQSKRAIVTGIDAARPLIEAAKKRSENPQPGETHTRHETPINYLVGDVRDLNQRTELHGKFDAAACVLAIQNITPIRPVFEGVAACLRSGLTTPFGGRFVVVLNHPAFRSPQFTSWGWDGQEMVQYRRVERYLLPRKHTIITHPGKDPRTHTLSFHQPIGTYVKALRQAGLFVEAIEEWASHKTSDSGPRARAENEARDEIPLFMAIRAVKISGAAGAAPAGEAPADEAGAGG